MSENNSNARKENDGEDKTFEDKQELNRNVGILEGIDIEPSDGDRVMPPIKKSGSEASEVPKELAIDIRKPEDNSSVVMEGPEKEGLEFCDLKPTPTCSNIFFEKMRKRTERERMRELSSEVLVEVDDSIYFGPLEGSLAHCVAEDMGMWAGIAEAFRHRFGSVGELLDQQRGVGDVAVLHLENHYIYYLITKSRSSGKPKLPDLVKALEVMRDHAVQSSVTKLAMPKIACELDGLDWMQVKRAIVKIFENTGIQITVYLFQPPEPNWAKKNRDVQAWQFLCPLVETSSKTGLIFFGFVDGGILNSSLNMKYSSSLQEFFLTPKKIGDVVRLIALTGEILYGLVIKERLTDRLSYIHLEKCMTQLNEKMKMDHYPHVGFEAFIDREDKLTVEKIINILRNGIKPLPPNSVNIFACWPNDLKNFYILHN